MEEAMKYVMLIYQGTAPERQAALPEEERTGFSRASSACSSPAIVLRGR
jgi:hypothetical protein